MSPVNVVGWDIGGVNTKAALVCSGDGREAEVRSVVNRPYELQRAPAQLIGVLRDLAVSLGVAGTATHAVTMTAELSQMFRTKREGVHFVLDAVAAAFPGEAIHVYCTDGTFRSIDDARSLPLLAAAANWVATAHVVAMFHPDALLIDIGTTTTDIVPIAGGVVVAHGRTDLDRLASGELVYTGALRTPVEAIVRDVVVRGDRIGVSAEGFALSGDVHLYRGDLTVDDYSVPTPDGRPATREFAHERLARVVCGDRELLDDHAIDGIAQAAAAAQVDTVASAIRRVSARHPSIRDALVTGLGEFIADAAARAAGLSVIRLADTLGGAAARCAPAAAVALLLERERRDRRVRRIPAAEPGLHTVASGSSRKDMSTGAIDAVIKFGGGALSDRFTFSAAIDAVQALATRMRVVIVPGGGPFADAVRTADRQLELSPDASHWMAVLAMDQYAELLVTRLTGAVRVDSPRAIAAALDAGRLPVLAPARWLREVDPLPHSWDVTSDSIAAWVSGEIGARLLLLVKPAGANGNCVDEYFSTALRAGVRPIVVPADRARGMLQELR